MCKLEDQGDREGRLYMLGRREPCLHGCFAHADMPGHILGRSIRLAWSIRGRVACALDMREASTPEYPARSEA